MVISGVNTVTYNGDGITTAWPYTFPVTDDSEIRVQLNNADGTAVIIESDYYVDLINSTVYYPGYAPGAEPPEEEQPPKVQDGQTITVYREIPMTQEADLGEKWPFEVIEKGLDKLTMIAQQIKSGTDRKLDDSLAAMFQLAGIVTDSDKLQHITDQYNAIDANAAAAAESEENAAASAEAAANSATGAANSNSSATATAAALTAYLETKETLTAPAVDATLTVSGAAADANITGGSFKDIAQVFADGSTRLYGGVYVNAGYSSAGALQYTRTYRVSSTNIFYANRDIILKPESGFRVAVATYTQKQTSSFVSITSLSNYPSLIPKGKYFNISIARETEDVTETADINDFVSRLSVTTAVESLVASQKQWNTAIASGKVRFHANDFVVGSRNSSGSYQSTFKYRITTTFLLYTEHELTIRPEQGFSIAAMIYTTPDNYSYFVDRTAYSFSIPAKRYFHIVIGRTTEDASEVATIDEFINGCEIINGFTDRMRIRPAYAFEHLKPYGINHRGYNSIAPENTLPAFRLSKSKGFDFVECDVNWTSDDVPVLLHNDTINATARNADGTTIASAVYINNITYEQALEYDFGIAKGAIYAGTKIPTFREFIELCAEIGLFPYIEIKGGVQTLARVTELVNIVKEYGMERSVSWISVSGLNLKLVTGVCPVARVGITANSDFGSGSSNAALQFKTGYNEVFLDNYASSVTTAGIDLAKAADPDVVLEVYGGIVNDARITGATTDVNNYHKKMFEDNIGDPDTGVL